MSKANFFEKELIDNFLPLGTEIFSDDHRRLPRKRKEEAPIKIEPLLSIAEAAKAVGVSRHRIDDAINSGELAFYPIGEKARKIKVSDLNKWLEMKRTFINDYISDCRRSNV